MTQYLMQITYTPTALSALIANPQDRREAVKPVIENLGGSMDHAWFAMGECDVVLIASFPDHTAAFAFSAALEAGGAIRSVKTTPLLGFADGVDALRRAATCGYQPLRASATAG